MGFPRHGLRTPMRRYQTSPSNGSAGLLLASHLAGLGLSATHDLALYFNGLDQQRRIDGLLAGLAQMSGGGLHFPQAYRRQAQAQRPPKRWASRSARAWVIGVSPTQCKACATRSSWRQRLPPTPSGTLDARRRTGSNFGGDLEVITTSQRECNTVAVYGFEPQRICRICAQITEIVAKVQLAHWTLMATAKARRA